MTTTNSLHILFTSEQWNNVKQLLSSGDKVLFTQDAVYRLPTIKPIDNISFFARELDCNARHIRENEHFEMINDPQWVEFCESANNILSW
ncbi:DsrH/TusB family sulfur metabolism protein [Psychrosphaera algicola]|uniref:DsrH/TusB family sulfur metabolism protein n=1 Tax=Psychrosphaera algicola TaxID=3023714 RepID=UPI00351CB8B9